MTSRMLLTKMMRKGDEEDETDESASADEGPIKRLR